MIKLVLQKRINKNIYAANERGRKLIERNGENECLTPDPEQKPENNNLKTVFQQTEKSSFYAFFHSAVSLIEILFKTVFLSIDTSACGYINAKPVKLNRPSELA